MAVIIKRKMPVKYFTKSLQAQFKRIKRYDPNFDFEITNLFCVQFKTLT